MLETLFRAPLAILPQAPAVADIGAAEGVVQAIGGPGQLSGARTVDAGGLVTRTNPASPRSSGLCGSCARPA